MFDHLPLPVRLSAAACPGGHGTVAGLYLRWLVGSHLGLPRCPPYPSHDAGGFTLYAAARAPSKTQRLDVVKLFQTRRAPVLPLAGHPGLFRLPGGPVLRMTAAMPSGTRFVAFAFRHAPGQTVRLFVRTSRSDGDVRVEQMLIGEADWLRPGTCVTRAWSVHADVPDRRIDSVEFRSDQPLYLGRFEVSEDSVYGWTTGAADDRWTRIEPGQTLLPNAPGPLIHRADPGDVLDHLRDFYKRYFDLVPASGAPGQLRFARPALSGLTVKGLEETFVQDDYRSLVTTPLPDDTGLGTTTRQALALAAMHPALAHVLGLFRVLTADPKRAAWFKVQAQWRNRRIVAYRAYDPTTHLSAPEAPHVEAGAHTLQRPVLDYATWRYHEPIRATVLRVDPGATPPAGFVLAFRNGTAAWTALASHQVAQPESDGRTRVVHATQAYPKSEVHHPLQGGYRYAVAATDAYGQVSPPALVDVKIDPIQLAAGPVLEIEVEHGRVQVDGHSATLLRPVVVVPDGAGHVLALGGRADLPLEVAVHWPAVSRFRFTRNRATGAAGVLGFRPLYLVDTPLSVTTVASVEGNGAGGLVVRLDQVSPGGINGALHHLFDRLGATSVGSALVPEVVAAALHGGTLDVGCATRIEEAAVSGTSILFTLLPFSAATRAEVAEAGAWYPTDAARSTLPFAAVVHWNVDARGPGAARLGWRTFASDLLIEPTQPVEIAFSVTYDLATTGYPEPAPTHATQGLRLLKGDLALDAFEVVVADDPRLAALRHLLLVHRLAGLEAGARKRQAGEAPEIPDEVDLLFVPDEMRAFQLTRVGTTAAGSLRFRGSGRIVSAQDPSGAGPTDYVAAPDPGRGEWVFLPPTRPGKLSVPLEELVAGGFDDQRRARPKVTVGVEVVVADEDPELRSAVASVVGTLQTALRLDLQPPSVEIFVPAPTFGIPACRPDRYGRSVLALADLFGQTDLAAVLPDDLRYRVVRLPADALAGAPATRVTYGWTGDSYRRRIDWLAARLTTAGVWGVSAAGDLERFASAEPVGPDWVDRATLLATPLLLPGNATSLFLFAIRALDPVSGKTLDGPVALGWPAYVPNHGPPDPPGLRSVRSVLAGNTLTIEARVARAIVAPGPAGTYDTRSTGYLADPSDPFHLGPNLPRLVRGYRLYVTNDPAVAARPEESDFAQSPVTLAFDPTGPAVPLSAATAGVVAVGASGAVCTVTGQVELTSGGTGVVDPLALLPEAVFLGVAAENHLGAWTRPLFAPARVERS